MRRLVYKRYLRAPCFLVSKTFYRDLHLKGRLHIDLCGTSILNGQHRLREKYCKSLYDDKKSVNVYSFLLEYIKNFTPLYTIRGIQFHHDQE